MQCAFLKLPELSVLDTAMRIQERERERNCCFGYVRYVWREINKSVDCHSWTDTLSCRWIAELAMPDQGFHITMAVLAILIVAATLTAHALLIWWCAFLQCSWPFGLFASVACHTSKVKCRFVRLLAQNPHLGWDAEEATEKAFRCKTY